MVWGNENCLVEAARRAKIVQAADNGHQRQFIREMSA
jgi:hypothetical protein